ATTLIVIIVAIAVKLILGEYVKRKGKQLKSDALTASGSDALFDAAITLTTLISAGIMLIWNVSLDGILSTLISAVIIKAGIEMLASPVNELLGARVPAELTRQIKEEVSAFEGVHGVFDLILHNYGPEVMIGSLHINVYDTLSAYDIHGLSRKISMQMYEKHGIIMSIGIYAISTGENQRTELQSKVMEKLSAHKEIIQIHGFYCSEKEKMFSVDVVPDMSVHNDAALSASLVSELQPLAPDMRVTVVIDHNYC
ncbi:MAG: cation transporter, partial [Bacteroidales bacterium]|nr:cation transporter [Bacteroidales bacterium]